MDLFYYGYLINEIENILISSKPKDEPILKNDCISIYCDKCNIGRVLMPDGCYSCPISRDVSCYQSLEDFIPHIWMKYPKSSHKLVKWFKKSGENTSVKNISK